LPAALHLAGDLHEAHGLNAAFFFGFIAITFSSFWWPFWPTV
jgi:hypothetical protein